MREIRGLGILVAVALAVAVGTGGGEVAGPSFPPEVEELLPQAVVLREVAVIEPLAPEGFALLGFHDLNHDGWLDLVVAGDRRVQVMFGDGRGGFSPGPWVYLEVEEYEEGARMPGRTVTERGQTRWEPYELEEREGKLFVPVQVFVHTGVMVDLDGDGILDLVVRGSGGPKEEWGLRLYLLRGLGEGKFARAGSLLYPKGLYISGLWAGEGEVLFTVAERDEPARLYRLSAPQGLENPQLEKLTEGPWILRWAGDLTGDGVLDLVVSTREMVQVLVGDGGGFQEGPTFSPSAGEVSKVGVGDLDGNGSLDLVVLTSTGIVTALWQEGRYVEAFFRDLEAPLSRHAVADLTGDGIPDLLVQRSTGFSEYYLLPGDGRGGFLGPVAELVVPDGSLLEPRFMDLNADGLLDVVFAPSQFGGGKVWIYLNGGAFPGPSLHPLPGALLAAGDLSGNGRPDILTADVGRRGAGVFWNDGRGGLVYRPLAALGGLPLAGALAPGVAYVLLPPTEWVPAQLVALDSQGKILGRWRVSSESLPVVVAADLDGDGLVDVALPAKRELVVLWGGQDLRTYRWPEGEVTFLAPGEGNLWAVSIGEYADLVEIRFPGRKLVVSDPLLQLEALPLTMTVGDLDGDGILDPVVLAVELGARAEDDEVKLYIERVVAGMVLSSKGPVVEEVPGFPEDHAPWPLLGAGVGSIAGKPHLVYTTSAGGGVFLVPWAEGWGEPVRVDVPGGPLLLADLDGNGEPEVLTATVGLGSLLAILWNGGGR